MAFPSASNADAFCKPIHKIARRTLRHDRLCRNSTLWSAERMFFIRALTLIRFGLKDCFMMKKLDPRKELDLPDRCLFVQCSTLVPYFFLTNHLFVLHVHGQAFLRFAMDLKTLPKVSLPEDDGKRFRSRVTSGSSIVSQCLRSSAGW